MVQSPVMISGEELLLSKKATERLRDELGGRGLHYHIESYGCQMNDHESEKIAGMLEEMGYTAAQGTKDADFIIFNTCCVREHAELRVFGNIGALKQLKDKKPGLIIAVCGCMMQQSGMAKKLYKRFPSVNIIFGTNELHRLPLFTESALSGERVISVTDSDGTIAEGLPVLRSSGFSTCVNIMYGCNNFCSYCIVPYVRGRERSRSAQTIIEEIRGLGASGYKEIMLLGQNVNSYAGDGGETNFPALLRLVNGIDGIERIRFMTSHPKDLSDELIEAMADLPKVCRHIHLPAQSGSTRILEQMNRRYTRDSYLELIRKLRSGVKDIEITTDIIVGFPGETEADFSDTLDLMREAGFSAAYTFMYSPRTGTKAAGMDGQIASDIKKERLSRLNTLQAELLRDGNDKYIGTAGEVLVEGCDERLASMAFGKLSNYKMVYFKGGPQLIGSVRKVIIERTQNNSLIGRLI